MDWDDPVREGKGKETEEETRTLLLKEIGIRGNTIHKSGRNAKMYDIVTKIGRLSDPVLRPNPNPSTDYTIPLLGFALETLPGRDTLGQDPNRNRQSSPTQTRSTHPN